MLDRLIGVETEFAIRFTPANPNSEKPDNDLVYDHVIRAVRDFVSTGKGDYTGKKQFFVQNGGAFNYEHLPYAIDGGLVEACTPECRSPLQALTYQRAMEALLVKALPGAEKSLVADGFYGTLGLLKNCRDAEGHTYGTQENYEAAIAGGLNLWVYRLAVAVIFPLILALAPITWALIIPFALIVFFVSLGIMISEEASSKVPSSDELPKSVKTFLNKMGYFDIGFMYLWSPILIPFLFLLRLVAFKRQRKILLPFLITRPIISGAGCLIKDGYLLSEKADAITGLIRTGGNPHEKPIFEISNLMKLLFKPVYFQLKPYFALFRKRQRIHLNLSDSNMCQTAEYLKLGTTALVLDMAESGYLKKIPRFKDPVGTLKKINRASNPTRENETEDSFSDALAIQREYHKQAVGFISQSDYTSIEAREIVRTWGRVLDMLEKTPDMLWGKIDWVTKREILNSAEGENDWDVLKKIDLKYHELGSGYHVDLENAGESLIFIGKDDIETAVFHPPEETPAYFRGSIIKAFAEMGKTHRFSWTMRPPKFVKKGTLIDFDSLRKK